jgi:thioredoxin reductase
MNLYGVKVLGHADVDHIEEGNLYIIRLDTGAVEVMKTDTIVPARGFIPNTELMERLEGSVKQLFAIGDSVRPGTIMEAVADGAYIARQI